MNIFLSRGKKYHEQQDYYHAFNHGAHAAPLFHDKEDFERFLVLLHIANNAGHFILRDMKTEDIFATMHTRALVDITAYCLLPDRYHIILRDRQPNGARHFIHKVGTAYVMYYNRKYNHKGTVFAGTYRARRVPDQSRLYELIGRIHLYPFSVKGNGDEVGEKKIIKGLSQTKIGDEKKERLGINMKKAVDQASQYEYSSMRDYLGEDRPQKVILETFLSS
jgi:putative transposase